MADFAITFAIVVIGCVVIEIFAYFTSWERE